METKLETQDVRGATCVTLEAYCIKVPECPCGLQPRTCVMVFGPFEARCSYFHRHFGDTKDVLCTYGDFVKKYPGLAASGVKAGITL